VNPATEFAAGDIRATTPRFTAQNRVANQALVEHLAQLAGRRAPRRDRSRWPCCWPSIGGSCRSPGTRRRERLEENADATQVALSADEAADLNTAAAQPGVHGNRYNDLHMGLVER
jgi:aryl-alcohol dehydrogenase-like predicted oxidoreductase